MVSLQPHLQRLCKLDESYADLVGLSFDDLSGDRQNAFKSNYISYMVIPYQAPKNDVFGVDEDMNSGGEDLTSMQVRRAVYHGPSTALLDDLALTCTDFHAIRDPEFFIKKSSTDTYEPCPKESDRELILRACAFRRGGEFFKPPLKEFLNREVAGTSDFERKDSQEQKRIKQDLASLKKEFATIMKVSRDVFAAGAFRKESRRITPVLWDSLYSALAELLLQYEPVDFVQAKDEIAAQLQWSRKSGYFARDDNRTTVRKNAFKDILVSCQGEPRDSRRLYPAQWKRPLFKRQDGKCAMCNQTMAKDRLDDPGYVHMDHKIPHSKGGRTDADNAQLVHSACNREKGASL